jgi:hypothetical protein
MMSQPTLTRMPARAAWGSSPPAARGRAPRPAAAGSAACRTQARAAAGADVDHRAHGGAGAGDGAEQAGHGVADALPHQLAVRVVAGAGHVVRHQRGEQASRWRRAARGSTRPRAPGTWHRARTRAGAGWAGAGNITERRRCRAAASPSRCRSPAPPAARQVSCPSSPARGTRRPRRRRRSATAEPVQPRPRSGCRRSAGIVCPGWLTADEAADLQDDDDRADTAHEAGHHRVGHEADVIAEAHERRRPTWMRPARMMAVKISSGGRPERLAARPATTTTMGPVGPGDLRRRAAEQRGEEADEDGAVEAGDRARAPTPRRGPGPAAGRPPRR